MAGTNNCYLNVECGPQGTTISFTLRLKPLEHEAAAPEARQAHVAIVADRAVERQDLAHMTEALGLQSTEARTMREALELNRETPAPSLGGVLPHGRACPSRCAGALQKSGP